MVIGVSETVGCSVVLGTDPEVAVQASVGVGVDVVELGGSRTPGTMLRMRMRIIVDTPNAISR